MLVPFSLDTLPVSVWKNGAGETREIVRIADDGAEDAFLWRASVATLQQDGPFSRFDGYDRIIVLLEGHPLWLRGGEVMHYLEPGIPWAFAGEWPLESEGITGKGMDFNIMTRRSGAGARVAIAASPCRPGPEGIAYVLRGEWEMAGSLYSPASGIWWQEQVPGVLVPRTPDAALIVTEITRRGASTTSAI